MSYLVLLAYLLLPMLILYGCNKWPVLEKIGPVLLCYGLGLALGNSGLLPVSQKPLLVTMSEISVALALPLLLFPLDVASWSRVAGKALLSISMAVLAVVVVTCLVFLSVNEQRPEDAWQLAAMSVGVYTGGAPNLASIKTALNIDSNTFIQFHTYDTLVALLYIVFMLSVAQSLFNLVLPRSLAADGSADAIEGDSHQGELASFREMAKPRSWPRLGLALMLSGACLVFSFYIGKLFPADYQTAAMITVITSTGVALSFVPRVRKLEHTFDLGMYLVYVFCLVVASLADLRLLMKIDWSIFYVVFAVTFGSMLLHALLCRVFKVDTDTFLITSVAAICSPPFVPLVAGALKNPTVLLSGLTAGIIGYAVGNYLGISIGYFLRALS